MNINTQPEMNNQNPFMASPILEQGINMPTPEVKQPLNNDFGMQENYNSMPMNDFNNIPPMEPQNNLFAATEMNNPFAAQTEQTNPFANSGMTVNSFEQPMNNMPEINPMNNLFQMETLQQPIDNSYGAGFATQVNQPNPAIDKIKILVEELRNNGFNIELSEADLMDSFQLTINIKK